MKKLAGTLALGACMALAAGPATAQDYNLVKAPGQYCKSQSKKKQPGQKKTPFAQCVSAIAKAKKNKSLSPAQACKGLSKKKAVGQKAKGTPFSLCTKGVRTLRSDQAG